MREYLENPPAPGPQAIVGYRLIWLLCTVKTVDNRKVLKATHYAAQLSAGAQPIWAVWTIGGVFQRFFGRKAFVEEAYSKHVWRRRQGTWGLLGVHEQERDERERLLKTLYRVNKQLPADAFNMAAAVAAEPDTSDIPEKGAEWFARAKLKNA